MGGLRTVLRVIFAIVVVAVTGLLVFFIIRHPIKDTMETRKPAPNNTRIVSISDGRKYTESTYSWKPAQNNGLIQRKTIYDCSTTYSYLYIGDNKFYRVLIPDVPVSNDIGKSIKADDGSFEVYVKNSVNRDTLSRDLGLKKVINIDKDTIQTDTSSKGKITMYRLLSNTIAIVYVVYDGSENYAVLHESITEDSNVLTITKANYDVAIDKVDNLVYDGIYAPTLDLDASSLTVNYSRYMDGYLYAINNLEGFDSCRDRYLVLLQLLGTGTITKLYESDGVLYAESGNYEIGLSKVNTNQTYLFLGYGEEGKCNIIDYISKKG